MNARSTPERRRIRRPRASTPGAAGRVLARPRGGARSSLRGAVEGVIRGAILEAAETVFGERGFAGARMVEVAERAGVAAGTLYNYYDSKESLFRALIEHRAEEFMGGLEAIVKSAPRERQRSAADPLEQLLRLTEATFAYVESHAAVFMLFEQVGGHAGMGARQVCGPSGDRLRGRYLQLFRTTLTRAVRAGQLRADLPLDDLALIYAGSVHGLLRGWALDGRKGGLRDRARLLHSVFLDGTGMKS